MAKKVSKEEYDKIKAALEQRGLFRRQPKIENVALWFKRSRQTVLYIQGTADYEAYERFKKLHNKRKPLSTLGKTVRAQGKRIAEIEALLFGIGVTK